MITIYTAPSCIQCTITKKALTKHGLTYTEVDVTIDLAAADKLRAAGHQALPVVDADQETWSGFRPEKIQALTR